MTAATDLSDTLLELTDIRLRVYNRERIPSAEMRRLLHNIIRDRESAKRLAAKTRTAAKRTVAVTPPTIDINELFGVKT